VDIKGKKNFKLKIKLLDLFREREEYQKLIYYIKKTPIEQSINNVIDQIDQRIRKIFQTILV
jgi:hypothetical protein